MTRYRALALCGMLVLFLVSCTGAGPTEGVQYYWRTNRNTAALAETEAGCWFFSREEGLVSFYDPAAGQTFPLCARPECTHTAPDCQAAFSDVTGLWAADGALYVFAADGAGRTLWRVSPDGSRRKSVLTLPGGAAYLRPMLHRGVFYALRVRYGADSSEERALLAWPLAAPREKTLYVSRSVAGIPGITQFLAWEDSLYLLDYAAGSQDPDAAPRTLYRIRDGEEPTALPVPAGKSVRSFMPCGDSLYYTVQASQSLYDETEAVEVWRCAPDFSDAEYLCRMRAFDFSCDETYFYGVCERGVQVMKHTGEEAAFLETEALFGPGAQLYGLYAGREGRLFLRVRTAGERAPALYEMTRTDLSRVRRVEAWG